MEIWWVHCNWERGNKCALFGPIYSGFSGRGWALGTSCHCLVCTALSWRRSALLQSPDRHPKLPCRGNWWELLQFGLCACPSQLCCLSAGAVACPEQLHSAGQPSVAQHSKSHWFSSGFLHPVQASASQNGWGIPWSPAWTLQQQEFELTPPNPGAVSQTR